MPSVRQGRAAASCYRATDRTGASGPALVQPKTKSELTNERLTVSRDEDDWVTAERAAKLLGVQRDTLYAYVSRGLIRAQSEGRRRLYARRDLETVRARADARRGHAALAASALRFGEPVLDTRITKIDLDGPRYRGHSALELAAQSVSAERVAELLWSGVLPEAEPRWPEPDAAVLERARLVGAAGLTPLGRMQLVLSLVPELPKHADLPSDGLLEARGLVRLLALAPGEGAVRARASRKRSRGLARALLSALGARDEVAAVDAVSRALILLADQELNASAFAARVAAGAGADLARSLLAASSTLSGSRHGGVCDRIEALVDGFERPEAALGWIRDELSQRRRVPGFGHPLYPSGDPRAAPLLAAARALSRGTHRERTLSVLADAMRLAGAELPTADFALVSLAAALGLPRGGALAVFALGRSLGHVAHVLEQREQGHLLRPRARYVGD
jgi:citrate synthase